MPAFHYSASSSESLTTQQQRLDEEVDLLGDDDLDETRSNNFSGASGHNLRTAPVLTGDALRLLGSHMFPQRATYGRLISQHRNDVPPSKPAAREIFINTNAPFSAVVCGVQVFSSLLDAWVSTKHRYSGVREKPLDFGAPRELSNQ